jgi:hypothetical protein
MGKIWENPKSEWEESIHFGIGFFVDLNVRILSISILMGWMIIRYI